MEKVFDITKNYNVGFYWLNVFMSARVIDEIIYKHFEYFGHRTNVKFIQQIIPKEIGIMESINCKSTPSNKKHQMPINCKFQ